LFFHSGAQIRVGCDFVCIVVRSRNLDPVASWRLGCGPQVAGHACPGHGCDLDRSKHYLPREVMTKQIIIRTVSRQGSHSAKIDDKPGDSLITVTATMPLGLARIAIGQISKFGRGWSGHLKIICANVMVNCCYSGAGIYFGGGPIGFH